MSTTSTQPWRSEPGLGRLYRSRDDRVIGGVAAGIARYLGTDPVIVRLVFVVLALAGGGGVVAYLVAWIIVPEEPLGGPPGVPLDGSDVQVPPPPGVGPGTRGRDRRADPSLLVGLVLLVLGAGLLVEQVVPGFSWRFVGPAVLVAIGVLLLARGRAPR